MKKITLLLVATVAFAQMSWAGFPIGAGRWILTPGYSFYIAHGYWDNNGNYNAYSNGSFMSHYIGLSGGYGLSRRWDFLFSLPFEVQVDHNTSGTGNTYIAAGLGDAKLGLSYFFTDFDALNHVSLTGSLIIPLYSNMAKPFPILGYQSFGGELKLGFSGSATGHFRNPYYDIEVGVRQYFDSDGPTQLFANVTGGIPLDDYWKISGTLSAVNSLSTTTNSAQTSYNFTKNFTYVRAAFNVGRSISENVSIYGGLYADIWGVNIARGSGVSVSAVIKF
jgi:hypothetical protein